MRNEFLNIVIPSSIGERAIAYKVSPNNVYPPFSWRAALLRTIEPKAHQPLAEK
jgi:hypothetical protein